MSLTVLLTGEDPKTISQTSNSNKPLRHSRDVFHAWMLRGAEYAGVLDMPVLAPVHAAPDKLVAFSDAMNSTWKDFDCFVHFFEDDFRIERFWSNPKAYLEKLSKFQGVIGLDYSVCYDFPVALKDYNYWRNAVCTFWLQQNLPYAIPQARCEDANYRAVLAGYPKHSTLAIGARSMIRNKEDRLKLEQSIVHIVDELQPERLLWYGSDLYGVTRYPKLKGVEVRIYSAKGRGNLSHNGQTRSC